MESIEIIPVAKAVTGTVRVPGSKSITNRALPLAALCAGETELTGVLFAEDTWQMISALQMLGYHLEMDQKNARVRIAGRGGDLPAGNGARLMCGNSGTTLRFLAAMLSLGRGPYILDGVARMRERPIDQLVDQLRALGADISYEMRAGYPPIQINARGLAGGGCGFADAKSSQYISAILMAAPHAAETVNVNLLGPVTSEPYVGMTLRMMQQFGVTAAVHDQCGQTVSRTIQITPQMYRAPDVTDGVGHYGIEPDASNASYFLAAAAIVPGSSLTVAGLTRASLQGDIAFAGVLEKMGSNVVFTSEGITVGAPSDGKLRGIELDMNHIPDMVQTLAVTALFAEGTTTIRNVWNLRVKETDRLAALETELRKLGAAVETGKDWIRITPATPLNPPADTAQARAVSIATYDDHRMAMAFAIAGLRRPGIHIENPGCTAKTYPQFFTDLRAVVKH